MDAIRKIELANIRQFVGELILADRVMQRQGLVLGDRYEELSQPIRAARKALDDALEANEAELAKLRELLAGCRTVFALALDNGKNEQYASLETRRGSFIHCVKLMQDLDAALATQPTE